jgi:hypothetical protein
MMKPSFVSLEYQARDPENLTILRACRPRWVRNKDIAEAMGMTPAGAKRRNEFLQSLGLLERRRCGKEVQFCTTLLAYLANLRLGEEEPLAAMGAMRRYLDLTRQYSLLILRDLAPSKAGHDQGRLEAEYQRYREIHGVLAYLWPTGMLSKLWIDLEGFNRPGAVIYEINQLRIPLPMLSGEEYGSVASRLDEVPVGAAKTEEGQGQGYEDAWEYLSKELLTGQISVADYRKHMTSIMEELAESTERANQHYTLLVRLRQWLNQFQTVGPILVILKEILDRMLGELADLGLAEADLPEDIPVGLPEFEILPRFNEQTYSQIKQSYGMA